MIAWYVAYTRFRGEYQAAAHLSRQGFQVYLPKYTKIRRHARRIERVASPLFPRYLFVAMDIEKARCAPSVPRSACTTWSVTATTRLRCRPRSSKSSGPERTTTAW